MCWSTLTRWFTRRPSRATVIEYPIYKKPLIVPEWIAPEEDALVIEPLRPATPPQEATPFHDLPSSVSKTSVVNPTLTVATGSEALPVADSRRNSFVKYFPPPPVPKAKVTPAPVPTSYGTSASPAEHRADELWRIDRLLRAYLLRWRSTAIQEKRLASSHVEGFPASCENISREFPPRMDIVDNDCRRIAEDHWHQAEKRWQSIHARLVLANTQLPLVRLAALLGAGDGTAGIAGALPQRLPYDIALLAYLIDRSPTHRAAVTALDAVGLTTEMALHILCWDSPALALPWHVFDASQPLMRQRVIDLAGDAGLPQRALRIDPHIADYIDGLVALDSQLGASARLVPSGATMPDLILDRAVSDSIKHLVAWRKSRQNGGRLTVFFHGAAGHPYVSAAQRFLAHDEALLVVDVPTAAKLPDWNEVVIRVYREARLRNAIVLWLDADAVLADERGTSRWSALLLAADEAAGLNCTTIIAGAKIIEAESAFQAADRFTARVDFPPPRAETRDALWRYLLERALPREQRPLLSPTTLELLGSFQFNEGQIADAIVIARGLALAAKPNTITPEHLYEACRRQSARRLVSMAQRVQPNPQFQKLDTVVLREPAKTQLEELENRIKSFDTVYRRYGFEQRLTLGRGLVALFTGPPGTGKTMAATLLASRNQRDLYKVDVANVLSKFIGEMEKNLDRVFSDAQDANAILFFDEADALFGKRGEVERGQDRWANTEVNFLLQRIEDYTGTVILATNLRDNLDEAFVRRVQVLIHFDKPDAEARYRIYLGMFPPEVTPPDDADLIAIAEQFDIAGGNIKNAVLDAAFRAAARTRGGARLAITGDDVVCGVAREYQKIGKSITIGTFGKRFYDIVKRENLLG